MVATVVALLGAAVVVLVSGGGEPPPRTTRLATAGPSTEDDGSADPGDSGVTTTSTGTGTTSDGALVAVATRTGPSRTLAEPVVVPPIGRPGRPPDVALPGTPVVPSTVVVPTTTTTTTPAERADGLRVRVEVDRAVYAEDQPVVIHADVCNEGSSALRHAVQRGQEAIVSIVSTTGGNLATRFEPATGRDVDEWAPGQCRRYGPFRWWQEEHHFTDSPAHGFPVPPAGHYRVVVRYTGSPLDGSSPPAEGSAPIELDGVTVTVTTDRPSYGAGEPVVANVRVCNPFDRPTTQTIVWSPEAVIRIERDGSTVDQVHEDGPVEPRPLPFAPRQCVDHRFVWDRVGAEAGTYRVEALWWGHDHPRVGKGHDARPGVVPERVPFELR